MRAIDLIEAVDPYEPVSYDAGGNDSTITRTVAFMHEHCQPWLNAVPLDTPVYRGTHTTNKVFVRAVRPDRDPRDSNWDVHDLYNKLIEMVGGVANRTNSAFVTSSTVSANIYGNVRVAIPAGNFNYTWSPVWSDWFVNLGKSRAMLAKIMYANERNDMRRLFASMNSDFSEHVGRYNEYETEFERILYDTNSYDPLAVKSTIRADDSIKSAIASGNEIMLKCNAILYVDPHFYFDYIVPKYKELT